MKNTEVFGLDHEIGRAMLSLRADLLLLEANPLDTLAVYNSIQTVVLGRTPIPPY